MNVASATSAVSRPFAFMTPRGSDAVDGGAGTRIPSSATRGQSADAGEANPLVNRFPTIAFSYDTDASRLVMLYRDPANGKTVSQIPTEAALKQYKEAQQQEKNAERAALLKLTVGGGQGGAQQAGGMENGRADGAGSAASGLGTAANPIGGGKPLSGPTGSGGVGSSAATASVSQSVTATATSAGSSAARVNVVI